MTRSGNSPAARAARMLATASYIGKGIIPGQGAGLPSVPPGFQLLQGRDGAYLKGADGAYLYGRAA